MSHYFKNGGNVKELLDAVSIVRFISGNRDFVNGLEILKKREKINQNRKKFWKNLCQEKFLKNFLFLMRFIVRWKYEIGS